MSGRPCKQQSFLKHTYPDAMTQMYSSVPTIAAALGAVLLALKLVFVGANQHFGNDVGTDMLTARKTSVIHQSAAHTRTMVCFMDEPDPQNKSHARPAFAIHPRLASEIRSVATEWQ